MKGLLFSLAVLALLVGSNGCVAVSGQKNRDGIVENYSGVTSYPWLGSNDRPVVVAAPYYPPYDYYRYRSPYRTYYPSYRSYSSYGGGWRYDDCRGRIVRVPSYDPGPKPLTRIIGQIDINVHRN